MSYTGINDLVTKLGAGQKQRLTFNRILNTGATSVAGRWHECFGSSGTGGVGVLTGSAGVGVAMSSATVGALPINPTTVTPDTKHLLAMSVRTAAATVPPGEVRLLDLLYTYPSCVITTGAGTTLNNGASKPTRLGTSAGVRCMCAVVGAIGATIPIITVSYTNQSGTSGRVGYFAASAASQPVGSLLTGSQVSAFSGPDMIMQAGDSGIRSIDSYTVAAGTTGAISFVLYRDLADVPLILANTPAERDFLSGIPSLPQIDDDPCLALIANIGGATVANSVIIGTLMIGWG